MEIVKCWAIIRGNNGTRTLNFFETKEEAYNYIRRLARPDREQVHAVFQTFAGKVRHGYDDIWSDDFPEFNSRCGLKDGEYILSTEPELWSIIIG